MVQTLAQLQAGKLTGISRLALSENLTTFPQQIFSLAETLTTLDLSNNALTDLPDNFPQLIKLKILFLSKNNFTHLPSILSQCPALTMISFKSNQISRIDEQSLPKKTRWLILTDNAIPALPDSMGDLVDLQKLALAGNQLTALPSSMKNCKKLGLMRISANQLPSLPDWLFTLPKLAWLAFSGNPFARPELINSDNDTIIENNQQLTTDIPDISLADFTLKDKIGEGASGVIYKAKWENTRLSSLSNNEDIAVKLFKGAVTSDGYPQDELTNSLQAGKHSGLIEVIAKVTDKKQSALIMKLIPSHFYNLGLPPSLLTCTRDTFEQGTYFSLNTIKKIALNIAKTLQHLHSNAISHGDLYAHNTMISGQSDTTSVLLGDFGAASNLSCLPKNQQQQMEYIEINAFGCLIDDLLSTTPEIERQFNSTDRLDSEKDLQLILAGISKECMQHDIAYRPSFSNIVKQLTELN